MRADAQRNYDKIVETAREVFREQGYDASLDEVARRAGVGPGTLYRHFPKRENLIDAIMQSWVDRVHEAADRALAEGGTPREQLLAWFAAYVELISLHKGGPAKITCAMGDPASPIAGKCEALRSAGARVLDELRAQDAVRPDLDPTQVARLVGGVATVADQGELGPEQVRPMLEVLADGLLRQPAVG